MQNEHFNNFNKVKKLIQERYRDFDSDVRQYRDYFLSNWPDSISAIIFYGSCLNEKTKKETSTPDFFIVTDRYMSFHKSLVHSILNWVLTPSTYSLQAPALKGKYNVISLKDLSRETSKRAKDIYNLGRLSKRIALIHVKDESIREKITGYLANSFYSVAKKTLCLIESPFTLEQFIGKALQISYIGERRVEADDKTERLYACEKNFYDAVYSFVIDDLASKKTITKESPDLFSIEKGLSYRLGRLGTAIFLQKSRVRAKLRWPKSIYTFKGWVDVLLAKIERSKGIKIKLSEKERRYPLIYGWKYYFRFKRDKTLK